MKVYIAGPLCIEKEREFLEIIDEICKKLKLKTFLPHRDCGLWKSMKDVERIAKGDLDGFKDCKLLIAVLNGFNIGAGTAWEMGYAYANKIPIIAIKTDRKPEECIDDISAIIYGTTEILTSLEELKEWLRRFVEKNSN